MPRNSPQPVEAAPDDLQTIPFQEGASMLTEGITGLDEAGHTHCVVGGGPVGLAIATDLARRGQRVLLLESGRQIADDRIQSLAFASIVDPSNHDDMMIATSRRLGGTSHLWGARCLPYDPIDFEERDWVDAHWPIKYADVATWWEGAAEATRSGKPIFEAPDFELTFSDRSFDCSKLERWANQQQAQVIHADAITSNALLDVRTCATLTQIFYAESGTVEAIQVAHSLSGQKITLAMEHVILAAGGIECARILLSGQMNAPDRFGGADGALGRYYMGHVSGEIADITFTRPGSPSAFDYLIDANDSYVRRRIVPSAALQRQHRLLNNAFWPVVPPISDAQHGSAILSLVYLAMRWPAFGSRLVAEAIRKQHAPVPAPPLLAHLRNVIVGAPSAAIFGIDFLRKRYDKKHRLPGFFVHNSARKYGLSYHSEQSPKRDSRVYLSGQRDRLGLPSLIVDYRVHEDDIASVLRTHELLAEWLVSTGLGKLQYRAHSEELAASVRAQAIHGRHQIGLTRMGTHRRESVVNGDLATFDAPNLHVVSTSVLPTSGQANPTMTAIALGLRLSERLARENSRKLTPNTFAPNGIAFS